MNYCYWTALAIMVIFYHYIIYKIGYNTGKWDGIVMAVNNMQFKSKKKRKK